MHDMIETLLLEGRLDRAAEESRAWLRAHPEDGRAWWLLAHSKMRSGLWEQALDALQRATQMNPDDADAYNDLGHVLHQLGQTALAEEAFTRAIRCAPGHTAAASNLGLLALQRSELAVAESCFRRALQSDPTHQASLAHLGLVYLARQQPALAECYLRRSGIAQRALGQSLRQENRLQEALATLQEAVEADPIAPETHDELARVYLALGDSARAIHHYRLAIQLAPDTAAHHSNLGNALLASGLLDEAESSFLRALSIAPLLASAYQNLANLWVLMGRRDAALLLYDRALELAPELAEARLSRALLLLSRGGFEEGWAQYEWRWQLKPQPPYRGPRWSGGALPPRLLVVAEQGLGDTLQFVRYLPLLTAQGTEVWLDCPRRLHRLLSRSFPDVHLCASGRGPQKNLPWIPLLSLPLAFGHFSAEAFPRGVSYLVLDPERVARVGITLGPAKDLRVGVLGRGRATNPTERYRRVSDAELSVLAQMPGIELVPLDQHQDGPDAFEDTAALLMHLELVITSDTVLVHLSAALGRPTWLLLSAAPDWRWLLQGEDSAWYPSVRVFRQETLGDWGPVVQRVLKALTPLCSRVK